MRNLVANNLKELIPDDVFLSFARLEFGETGMAVLSKGEKERRFRKKIWNNLSHTVKGQLRKKMNDAKRNNKTKD